MTEPSFENSKSQLEKRIRQLINQPLIEFQEVNERIIFKIEIDIQLGVDNKENISKIKDVHIKLI
jgi:hypothetical protein